MAVTSTIKMDFELENLKTEFADGYVKKEKDTCCIHCKKKEGLFTLDAIFMMYCNDCFKNKKKQCKLEWFRNMKEVLLPCDVCLKSYTEEKRLFFHSCNRNGVDSCEHCGQQFYTRKSLEKHYKIVHDLVIKAVQKKTLITSPHLHTSEKPYEYAISGESFAVQLVTHTTSVNSLSGNNRLNRHTHLHTGEKPYRCGTCGKSFSDKSRLNSHIRLHTGEKPYQCANCCKSFSAKSSLNRHTRIHSGEKPYRCGTCGNSFSDKNSLNSHIRLHTGERPYQCANCCKSFSTKSSLNRHTHLHTGEKPYRCGTCGKSFTVLSNLNTHTRLHTGERPYQCANCGKSFSAKSSLNKHVRLHIREETYQCGM